MSRKQNIKLEERITKASELPLVSDWERNFLSSILEAAKRYGKLTGKQESVLQRVESNNNPEVLEARLSWVNLFNDDMRDKMKIAARYYLNNPPYFGDLARRALDDDVFIPTEKQYRAMVENKYVRKVLDNMESATKFPVGSMAQVRKTASRNDIVRRRFFNKMVMIVDYPDKVAGSAKGAIPVNVLPVGSSEIFETEVRWLKKARG